MSKGNIWRQINSDSDLPYDNTNVKRYVAYNAETDFFKRIPVTADFIWKMYQAEEVTHWAYVGIDSGKKPTD